MGAGEGGELYVWGLFFSSLALPFMPPPPPPPSPTPQTLSCQIIVFEPAVPLTKGAELVVHYQQHNEPAILRKLIAIVDKGTSEVTKKHPRHLPAKSSAIVDILFDRPVCLEPFSLVKDLGRVMLRHQGHTVATGIVLEVKESV